MSKEYNLKSGAVLKRLPLNKMKSAKYQRKLDKKLRKQKFDKRAMRPLVVSERNGEFNVIDGQRRLDLLRLNGEKDADVELFSNLSYKEEAALFRKIGVNSKTLSGADKFKAGYEADLSAERNIVTIIHRHGLTIRSIDPPGDEDFCTPTGLVKYYEKDGHKTFKRFIDILVNGWKQRTKRAKLQVAARRVEMIRGLFRFVKKHADCPDATLIKLLRTNDAESVFQAVMARVFASKRSFRAPEDFIVRLLDERLAQQIDQAA